MAASGRGSGKRAGPLSAGVDPDLPYLIVQTGFSPNGTLSSCVSRMAGGGSFALGA
ncbi:hypothetical protein MPLB_1570028 [Mesorhizobium sp. ORS 3324]|nr:hypothetical protein MPLB_1570028 [Mesorhizobium sp. ORS 3324]